MIPQMIAALIAPALLFMVWLTRRALTSENYLETTIEYTIDGTARKDKLLCAVAGLPGTIRAEIISYFCHTEITKRVLDDRFFYWPLYQDAIVRHVLDAELFIGLLQPHEYTCLQQMAVDILMHIENGTLESYLKHKYPLLGDIGLNLQTFHVPHPNQPMTRNWLTSVNLSQAERKYGLTVLLWLIFEYDYASYWVSYSGIRPCMKSGPQSAESASFCQLTNPKYLGAIMASDSSTSLPDKIQFTEDEINEIYAYFVLVTSIHCSDQEHRAMYARNDKFIRHNWSDHPSHLARFEASNLIKNGQVDMIPNQDPSLLKRFLEDPEDEGRAYRLMFILVNICDKPDVDYEVWIDFLRKSGISELEYEALFGPNRLSEEQNLFLEFNVKMRTGIIEHSASSSVPCRSDIPVWLWYKAVMAAALSAPDNDTELNLDSALEFLIAAYRLSKVKKDQKAMELFANRALLTIDWKNGPSILRVPMDPIFMKGLLNHRKWRRYIKHCFAYAVVHGVTEIIESVLQKLLAEYHGNLSVTERFCLEMLKDGYIPEAYMADFHNVTAQLMTQPIQSTDCCEAGA